MACFIVPGTEAVVTTIVTKVLKKKEQEQAKEALKEGVALDEVKKTPFSHKLSWLNTMLWGGSALLAFEHVWHGEVVPWFPFLTAINNGEVMEMLSEMSTVGVSMAVLITLVWGAMVAVSSALSKRPAKGIEAEK